MVEGEENYCCLTYSTYPHLPQCHRGTGYLWNAIKLPHLGHFLFFGFDHPLLFDRTALDVADHLENPGGQRQYRDVEQRAFAVWPALHTFSLHRSHQSFSSRWSIYSSLSTSRHMIRPIESRFPSAHVQHSHGTASTDGCRTLSFNLLISSSRVISCSPSTYLSLPRDV
jgi:hypothetical protein